MSTAEMIYDRARTLPEDLQKEALHYLEYLRICQSCRLLGDAMGREIR